MTPENKLKAKVTRRLDAIKKESQDLFWFKLHGGPMQMRGLPDLYVLWRGVGFFIELKAPGRELTKLQEHVGASIRAAGGKVFVVWSTEKLELVLENVKP